MKLIIKDGCPVLPGYCPAESGGVHIAAWCCWCEQLHLHGAAGGNHGSGHRCAHCISPASRNPFQSGGYHVEYRGNVARYDDVPLAVAPLAGRLKLSDRLKLPVGSGQRIGRRLSVTFLKTLFPQVAAEQNARYGITQYQAHGLRWTAWETGKWSAHEVTDRAPGCRIGEGQDLLSMLEQLYGVPFQIAVAKIIEAMTGARIDYRSIRRVDQ